MQANETKKVKQKKFARFIIPLVSFLYKNIALVLLSALFVTFLFYGSLISFFLLSHHWCAPFSLTVGHELVIKAQRQLNALEMNRNEITQSISKEQRDMLQHRRVFDNAGVLLNFIADTLHKELEQRELLLHDIQLQGARFQTLQDEVETAIDQRGMVKALQTKYNKRLINRSAFDASLLAILELHQRLVTLQGQIESNIRERLKVEQSIVMLKSMREQVQNPVIDRMTAAGAEFVPLADGIMTAETTASKAEIEMQAHQENLIPLKDNLRIVDETIAAMSGTPLVRAARNPVDVLFVPYANIDNFAQGQPLYACRFGIVFCRRVGTTGKEISGEVEATHPFFGKNMRGTFVEAELINRDAVREEVLHVGHPPLYF